ncbi:MAG: ABC transporter ATP-binding protein [Rhizobiaceae bacterium]
MAHTQSANNASPVLEVKNLRTHFQTRRGELKAVNNVSFSLARGETLGLVGESGSGKSMTCFSILRMIAKPAGKIVGGEVLLDGTDLLKLSEEEIREVRGKGISMILQDPMTSLNPLISVGKQVAEPLHLHQGLSGSSLWDAVREVLALVRIPAPERRLKDYPHQMSGGMRQRIVGAISVSCRPRVLIADEPTTALDVTIQAQFLKLLKDMQKSTGLGMILVTHDLGIVAKNCDRVAVMYAGKIVEIGSVRDIFDRPAHPYTRALLRSLPKLSEKHDRLPSIEGQPPDLLDLPAGCSFQERCPHAMPICRRQEPEQTEIAKEHLARCFLVDEEAEA